ncbi:hypothetical protein QM306_39500, partial [Burkholderia cenocepacia]|nr:hypothetical protein [Burkholderia cenocepacia]
RSIAAYDCTDTTPGSVFIAAENYGAVSVDVSRVKGFMSRDCGMTAVHLFLTDHKATTINRILDDVKQYRASHPFPGITVRLAAGNAGVLAAT